MTILTDCNSGLQIGLIQGPLLSQHNLWPVFANSAPVTNKLHSRMQKFGWIFDVGGSMCTLITNFMYSSTEAGYAFSRPGNWALSAWTTGSVSSFLSIWSSFNDGRISLIIGANFLIYRAQRCWLRVKSSCLNHQDLLAARTDTQARPIDQVKGESLYNSTHPCSCKDISLSSSTCRRLSCQIWLGPRNLNLISSTVFSVVSCSMFPVALPCYSCPCAFTIRGCTQYRTSNLDHETIITSSIN